MRAAVLVEYNNEEIKITIATNLQRNPIWWIILDVFAYAKKKRGCIYYNDTLRTDAVTISPRRATHVGLVHVRVFRFL